MSDPKPLLLLVDDEAPVRALLAQVAAREGFDTIVCDSGAAGIQVLRQRHVDLMYLDLHMPQINGLDVLRATHEISAATHIVLMTGAASVDTAVEAMKLGAEDYVQKPLELARVVETMRAIRAEFQNRTTILASDAALAERLEFCGIIGRSPAMMELFALIRRLAPHARSVLITGETGVGKELVARALHSLGPRRSEPFVTVNCSAVVETLFETELFGHVRGAFTGATDGKPGLFEAADRGTLFLDEVGELPLGVQGKLLRALEVGEIQRVGAVSATSVDVRVISATNRDLAANVDNGAFRSDLFYRLNVFELRVPPLRERPADIPYLTAAFLRRYAHAFNKPISGLTPAAERLLTDAPWPGNVRQLRNVIERACLLSEGHLLAERDIVRALGAPRAPAMPSGIDESAAPPAAPTKEHVEQALEATGGNKALAARRLNISRRALYRLIAKYSLEKP
jgi:DNA-binding NtrC family response regulator